MNPANPKAQGHTPGPWSIIQDAPENPKARFQIGRRFNDLSATYVCTIRTERNITCDGNHEANARLIAAAPELLEALSIVKGALMEASQDYNHPHFTDRRMAGPRMSAALQAVNKALEKAT